MQGGSFGDQPLTSQPVTQDPLARGPLRAIAPPRASVLLESSPGSFSSSWHPPPWHWCRLLPCLRLHHQGGLIKCPAVLSFRNACLPRLGLSPELCWAQPLKAPCPLLAGSRLAPLTPRKGVSSAVSPN